MKRVILVLLITLLALAQKTDALTEFNAIIPLKNIFGQTVCTAFVINQENAYLMTADHCMDSPFPLTANGQPIEELEHNQDLDVAILSAPGVKGIDPLQPNLEKVSWEGITTVYAVGYADGRDYPTLIKSTVVFPEFSIPVDSNPWIMLSPEPIGGMSGGPIMDANGKVIAIVQQGGYALGISRPLYLVKDLVEKYWAKPAVD